MIRALTSAPGWTELPYKKALDNWRARDARKQDIAESFKKQEATIASQVVSDTEQRKDEFRQALIDRLVNRFP